MLGISTAIWPVRFFPKLWVYRNWSLREMSIPTGPSKSTVEANVSS